MSHKDLDLELLNDCRKGNKRALESLVRRYEKPLYNAAFRMLGSRDEAADVVQGTFLKAIENLGQFNPKYKFFSWIYRIAINESINQINRRKREAPLDEFGASTARSPDELADSLRIGNLVQSRLLELQEEHRAVIVLRHFSGLSYRDMSEVLQIPEKTVKSRLFTARQQLKDRLKDSEIYANDE